jgi:glycosyltransferase involved in cell wall biosynthesis
VGVYWFWIAGRIPSLRHNLNPHPRPTVSVIVTACNEGDTIGAALKSLLALDYSPLEIIVVNDRSTDQTGAIIDDVIRDHDHVRVIHNTDLPTGWLGKVHALELGQKESSGDWLLFTDADVVYRPGVIEKAVLHAEKEALDHLSLIPKMITRTWPLDITVCAFTQLGAHKVFGLNPIPFGAGAFNLVRRVALQRSPGLSWLKMEVADDAGLALLIAESGGTSRVQTALDGLEIVWYPTLPAMFHGLEKNAGLLVSQGRPWRVFAVWLIGTAMVTLPFIGAVLHPTIWPIFLAGIGAYILATLRLRIRFGTRPWLSILAPLGFVLVGSCGLWSIIQILRRGGIDWRGTFYSWNELVDGQRVKL